MERREMRGVPVNLAFIEVIVDFLCMRCWDVVRRAPDFTRGGGFGFKVGELWVWLASDCE